MWPNFVSFSELVGKTVTDIDKGDDVIHFTCDDGTRYDMYHDQDCCECVTIEDICGSLDDLIGSPILEAYESSEPANKNDWGTSTWTFYRVYTAKGAVTIRWYGESNGYYSEGVSFVKVR